MKPLLAPEGNMDWRGEWIPGLLEESQNQCCHFKSEVQN